MTVNRRESGRSVARRGMLLALALLVGGALALCLVPSHPTAATSSLKPLFDFSSASTRPVSYGQLPLIFEANQGQSDPRVKFMARGAGYGLFLTSEEAVLSLQPSPKQAAGVVRMALAGANANAEVSGDNLLPGKSNYLIGNDASKWHRNVPQFARVRYSSVYPGVDLIYYGNQGKLEYDFEVAPGADPKQVALTFQGAQQLSLDGSGNLVVAVNGRDMNLEAPRVYQTVDGEQKPIQGRFALRSANQVGFELGNYDRSRALVIDPVLTYSTYLGGGGTETFTKIAVDSAFSAYVSGTTTSSDFPIPVPASGAAWQKCIDDPTQPQPSSCAAGSPVGDTFIAKFDSAGATLVFATYLGGDGLDVNGGIAVDSGFTPVVVGTTNSTNFPTKNAYQAAPLAAGNHVYVAKLDSTGQNLLYSTYLSGTGAEAATGVALDLRSKIYVTGTTTSTNFPTTTDAFQATSRAANQFFVTRIDPATSGTQSLAYSTYFGGGNPANGVAVGGGIAVDKTGGVYITGGTNFQHTGANTTTDFPILNAFQACLDRADNPSPCPTNLTATDAFVAKLNPTVAPGSQLVYSTYVGGTGDEVGNGVAADSGGIAYVTGSTNSNDIVIPTSTTPFQKCLNDATNPATCSTAGPNTDAFLAKVANFTGSTTTAPNVTLVYFSYLGGSGNDAGQAVAVDTVQGARITGSTSSSDFHTIAAVQGSYGGGTDAFAARIDTTATSATAAGHYSTFLGGSDFDTGTGIAVDSNGVSYISGQTASTNFPVASAFQGALHGSSDAFVTKLGGVVSLAIAATPAPTPNPVGAGNPVTFTYKVTNNGDLASGITLRADVSSGSFGSVTPAAGNCGSPTGVPATVTCNLGTLNSAGTTTVTLVASPTAGGPFGTSAIIISPGSSASASASVNVTDYDLSLSPNSQTVVAGSAASYTAQVVPHGSFPNTVSVACSGLPTGASCSLTPNSSITNLTNGSPQSRTLVVNTTARVTTTVELQHHGPFYAVWLPVSGLAFLGLGVGTMSLRRRILLGLAIGVFVTMILAQAGCGSSTKSTTTTTGTPAGTYTFTVTATSSAFSRSQTAQLIVQ